MYYKSDRDATKFGLAGGNTCLVACVAPQLIEPMSSDNF
jgi:hypothetical protein